jgi:hypothetical protein
VSRNDLLEKSLLIGNTAEDFASKTLAVYSHESEWYEGVVWIIEDSHSSASGITGNYVFPRKRFKVVMNR